MTDEMEVVYAFQTLFDLLSDLSSGVLPGSLDKIYTPLIIFFVCSSTLNLRFLCDLYINGLKILIMIT